jgi:hypothetical protein
MRLSTANIQSLKVILREDFGLVFDDEEAQKAGLEIMRFIVAKQSRLIERKANKVTRNRQKAPNFSEKLTDVNYVNR